ncbi:hypothetical protein GGI23_000640, partial [Coemansia sp. RSA 2559]
TFTGTATPYIINIPPLRYPQLPNGNNAPQPLPPPQSGGGGAARPPQLGQSVTYRDFSAPGAAAAVESPPVSPMTSAQRMQTKGDPYEDNLDPYSYDVPGYEADQQAVLGHEQQPQQQQHQGNDGSGSAGGAPPPPPYSSQPHVQFQLQQPMHQQQQQQAPVGISPSSSALPVRTEGTYSSSYEHTAAWVQGSASQTTGSDTAGPAHHNESLQHHQQQQPVVQYAPPPQQHSSQPPPQQQQQQQQQYH